jgi:hypothetical protein
MKTTIKTISAKYTQEGRNVTCDLVSEIQFMNVKNMDVFVQIPEVYAYLSKVVDSRGKYIVHTRGVAKCMETDTFDYETGRRIANTKAQAKIFGIACLFFNDIEERITADLLRCSCNCAVSEWQCYDHVEELSDRDHVEGLVEVTE